MGGADKILRPCLRPLHRAAQLHGAEGGNHVPGVDGNLRAKAAAHFRGDYPYLVFRDAGNQARHKAGDVGVLGGVPESEFTHSRYVGGDGRTRLHRIRYQLLLDDGVSYHHRSVGEGIIGITPGGDPVEGLVARGVFVQLGRALLRGRFRVNYNRQRFVVHGNQFQRVLGLVAVFRHHHGHGVAHVPHHVLCDGRVGDGLNVGVGNHPGAGHGVEHSFRVRARINRNHPRGVGGRRSVNARNAGVSVGAAQNGGVDQADQLDVVGVGGLAGDKAGVFAAADAGAEKSGSHGLTSPGFRSAPE